MKTIKTVKLPVIDEKYHVTIVKTDEDSYTVTTTQDGSTLSFFSYVRYTP
jgi:hypothetical protein